MTPLPTEEEWAMGCMLWVLIALGLMFGAFALGHVVGEAAARRDFAAAHGE